jgi:signal transduction histidine kinase
MAEAKERVESALVRARAELDEALYELEKLPAVSPGSINFAAHALNNFLTVAGGTVEMLLVVLADHPDPQVRTLLESLQQAARLMTHTIDRLVNPSPSEEIQLRFEEVDLPTMVQRFAAFYQRAADRKRINIVVGSTLDVPLVWTDRVAIAAVLDNLLSNAVKYSPHGKRVLVQIAVEQAGVVCSVLDEGPGLSPEDQARLFQRGVRLTPQPTGNESSAGYGLAVAADLIAKLGGAIWCESILGQGSCFAFRLPRSPHQTQQAQQSPATAQPGAEVGGA